MRIRFAKMHGAGNDFVLVDDRDGAFPCDRRVLAAIGARGTGVGCEGIILVQESDRAAFLQNGRLQSYILYGIVFIVVTILLTFVLC